MMASSPVEQLICASASWDKYWGRVCGLPDHRAQGDAFERVTQLYLQTASEYRSKLRSVWRLEQVPTNVARSRPEAEPSSRDEGIDHVSETVEGTFWAIQCKFRSKTDKPLTRRDLAMWR